MNTNLYKVAIFSVPRSGSSWLGQIFNSSPNVAYRFQPLFSYAFKARLDEKSSTVEIDQFHNDILSSDDDFLLQKKNITGNHLYEFEKKAITHLVWKEVRYLNIIENLLKKYDIKIISLVRNPFAVISSWLKAPKEFRKDLGWKELEEWKYAKKKNLNKKEEFNGFEKWKEVAHLFLKLEAKYPTKFIILKYNTLFQKTIETTERIFNFVDLNMTNQTIEFIKESKSRDDDDPYGVFKIRENDDNWKIELDKLIVKEIFNELNNTELEKFLK